MSLNHPNFISHLRKYVSLSNDEIPILLAYIKILSIKKKAFLFKEGQVCRSNYFVEKGCLKMSFINEKGTEQITQFALESWWISDYMSFSMQISSQFDLQSIEDSVIIAVDHHQQEELFLKLPQLERYFRLMMQRAYAATQMRFKYFHDYSKEENYRHFIAKFPEFTQRIPQYMLASYLGLTPEYVSELRRNIKTPNHKDTK
jgi:CRP/FNR family transcriptional regulator